MAVIPLLLELVVAVLVVVVAGVVAGGRRGAVPPERVEDDGLGRLVRGLVGEPELQLVVLPVQLLVAHVIPGKEKLLS